MANILRTKAFNKWFVFELEGRIDSFNDKYFFESFKKQEQTGHPLVAIDFSKCEFLSYSVLKYIKEWSARLDSKGGRLVLVALQHSVKRQFEIFVGTQNLPSYLSFDEMDLHEWQFEQKASQLILQQQNPNL
jgi:anti-anti-sigma regulatory factor